MPKFWSFNNLDSKFKRILFSLLKKVLVEGLKVTTSGILLFMVDSLISVSIKNL